jgi:hypothetical protein
VSKRIERLLSVIGLVLFLTTVLFGVLTMMFGGLDPALWFTSLAMVTLLLTLGWDRDRQHT